ncbi:hypothetical protein BDA96_06G199100 [Sorghum bicolor]|uniref:Dof zinc finger protein n=1 Tax=Sorghum bicolor TaxID=4558 RepID=A0A921QS02_SORBI|nr:dof zinc finger protein DOF4.6 isoform X2 [Sorghum bicolor]KAG0527054.1 hypothetical protein BDA96_06G199100 [Sorghum bicolor]|eukprot:XP_021319588.1 dof zinc finger protein DOF4.6 isoform X2 [Sorghum bicolor]
MDAAHWQQGLGLVKPMEEMLMAANAGAANPSQGSNNPNPPAPAPGGALRGGGAPAAPLAGAGSTERRARPQKEKALNCPRCNSTNTKFCYYNNYSLQQPRYFCKTCRRYWTEGGSLRNVPVGGGSRKNKRSSSSASASASTSASVTSSSMASAEGAAASKNPKLAHEGAHDLNLAFPHHGGLHAPEFAAFPSLESSNVCNPGGGMTSNGRGGGAGPAVGALSAMELLRSSGCYMPLQMPMQMQGDYTAAEFALGDFRTPPPPPSQSVLGFSLDAHGPGSGAAAAGYGSSAGLQGVTENAGRLLFPFEDLKPPVSSGGGGVAGGATGGAGDGNSNHNQFDHNKEQDGGGGPGAGHDTPGFWSGMIGGSGASW